MAGNRNWAKSETSAEAKLSLSIFIEEGQKSSGNCCSVRRSKHGNAEGKPCTYFLVRAFNMILNFILDNEFVPGTPHRRLPKGSWSWSCCDIENQRIDIFLANKVIVCYVCLDRGKLISSNGRRMPPLYMRNLARTVRQLAWGL